MAPVIEPGAGTSITHELVAELYRRLTYGVVCVSTQMHRDSAGYVMMSGAVAE